MRLPNVPLAFAAGFIFQLLLGVQPAAAASDTDGIGKITLDRCVEIAEEAGGAEARVPEIYVPAAQPLPVPTPLGAELRKLADEESYMDVFGVLKEENSCSRFFGGPVKAVEAFNGFARQLRRKALGEKTVAVRMSGTYTRYQNIRTGASYRLFEEAAINNFGPFNRTARAGGPQMRVGRFPAFTRGARALILLHELGHLIEGADGKWLLPNDGHDAVLSDSNTRTVERHCGEQLRALRD